MQNFPWIVITALAIIVAFIYIYFDPFGSKKPPTTLPSPPRKKVKQTFTTWKEDKRNHVWFGFNSDGKLVAKIHKANQAGFVKTKFFDCLYVVSGSTETYLSLKQAKNAVDEYNWYNQLPAIEV